MKVIISVTWHDAPNPQNKPVYLEYFHYPILIKCNKQCSLIFYLALSRLKRPAVAIQFLWSSSWTIRQRVNSSNLAQMQNSRNVMCRWLQHYAVMQSVYMEFVKISGRGRHMWRTKSQPASLKICTWTRFDMTTDFASLVFVALRLPVQNALSLFIHCVDWLVVVPGGAGELYQKIPKWQNSLFKAQTETAKFSNVPAVPLRCGLLVGNSDSCVRQHMTVTVDCCIFFSFLKFAQNSFSKFI